ncbi:MAG: L-seryl-tRNA(Sec) selenium transferase [Nitrospirota bacterium]
MKTSGNEKHKLLSELPSVDEILKSSAGNNWLAAFPRRIVLQAIRDVISGKRKAILEGLAAEFASEILIGEIEKEIRGLLSYNLVPVINATGIVIHTNLGRAPLSKKIIKNISSVGEGFSNLEYDLENGRRGKRHAHAKRLIKQITGADDGFIVNNNAAAVLLCLNTIAKGKEVIVSRSELVEIGGSFRVPDVMAASGAILREVGTTNKTHLYDYKNAINENTGLILKVHQSNYKIIGFTDDVKIDELVSLGRKKHLPVMYDLGSGCLLDLKQYGIHTEPSVQEIVKAGVDIISFSGDKLLGGPQGGIIVGKKKYIEKIQKNPMARALRTDKLTIAAFEATLMEYLDTENAKKEIPVLKMLFQSPEEIRSRARKIAAGLRKVARNAHIDIVKDTSRAGGGSLPETEFPTFAVSLKSEMISVNELESRLRKSSPPVISRIKGHSLLLDARTIRKQDIKSLVKAVSAALSA